jgi:carotenoid cleavage dioxygenase
MNNTSAAAAGPMPNPLPKKNLFLKRRKALGTSPYVLHNNRPTFTEGSFDVRVVAGAVPADLTGHYTRVGGNPRFDTDSASFHPFDGDGMIHDVNFQAGQPPTYSKRWVRTKKFDKANKQGFDVFGFGELSEGIFENQRFTGDENGEPMGPANTNIVTHKDRSYALFESDKPYRVNYSNDPETNLATVGRETFEGQLEHPVTAHPKVDFRTDEFVTMGYTVLRDPFVCSYSVIGPDMQIKTTAEIPMPHPVLMHDMAITENHSILFDINYQFHMDRAFTGQLPWVHERNIPARFGVFPRHLKDVSQVQWIDVAPCGLFHFANAWEEDGTIHVFGCRSMYMDVGYEEKGSGKRMWHEDGTRMHEWVLDLKSGKCVSERVVSDHIVDFAQVDKTREGYKTRFLYATEFDRGDRTIDRPFPEFKNIIKYDLLENTTTSFSPKSQNGNPMIVSESVFCPSQTRNHLDDSHEDHGYITCFAFDEITDKSECIVLDARTMQVAVALSIPERVPNGFHATWVHGALTPQSKL